MQPSEPRGIVAALAQLGNGLVAALPPAFLMLVVLNTFFIAGVLWFVESELEQRTAMANRILDHCLRN
jgi:hypothetical protein